jgi:hypothetical protein
MAPETDAGSQLFTTGKPEAGISVSGATLSTGLWDGLRVGLLLGTVDAGRLELGGRGEGARVLGLGLAQPAATSRMTMQGVAMNLSRLPQVLCLTFPLDVDTATPTRRLRALPSPFSTDKQWYVVPRPLSGAQAQGGPTLG